MGDRGDGSGATRRGPDDAGPVGPVGPVDQTRSTGPGVAADDRAAVAALLSAAGLDPPADEIDRLADLHPGLRRSVERFHAVDAGDGSTAAIFRAGEVS